MVYLTFDNVAFNAEYGDGKDYLTEAVLSQEVRRAKLHQSEDDRRGKRKASPGEVRSADKQRRRRLNGPGVLKLKVRASRVCLFCKLDHQLPYSRTMSLSRSRERRRTRSRSKDIPNRKSPARWSRTEKTEQRNARNAGSRLSPRRKSRRHEDSRRTEKSTEKSPEKSPERSQEQPVKNTEDSLSSRPVKPKRTPITPPEDNPAKRNKETPKPRSPPERTPPVKSTPAVKSQAATELPKRTDIKDAYRFDGAYTTVELISETSLERVEQRVTGTSG
jgi:hypothetical protein